MIRQETIIKRMILTTTSLCCVVFCFVWYIRSIYVYAVGSLTLHTRANGEAKNFTLMLTCCFVQALRIADSEN